MSTKSDVKLAYLLVSSPIPNVFIGGMMVTDSRGLPLEFRYTEPIQPSKIQQILYGQVLSAYIKREVILETLLKGADTKFKCLLVEDENLVEHKAKGYSVIRMMETKSSPLGEVGLFEALSETEILLQVTEEGSPLRLHLPSKKQQAAEKENGEGATTPVSRDPVYKPLLDAGKTMDVQEPIRRIEKALQVICQEAGINSQDG